MWRTKLGDARWVEHPSRQAADAYVEELRARYRAGQTRVSLVRLQDPEGGLRLIDFAREARDAGRALSDVEWATKAKDRAIGEAMRRWEVTLRRAVGLGLSVEDVAAAAGINVRQVRAILRGGSS